MLKGCKATFERFHCVMLVLEYLRTNKRDRSCNFVAWKDFQRNYLCSQNNPTSNVWIHHEIKDRDSASTASSVRASWSFNLVLRFTHWSPWNCSLRTPWQKNQRLPKHQPESTFCQLSEAWATRDQRIFQDEDVFLCTIRWLWHAASSNDSRDLMVSAGRCNQWISLIKVDLVAILIESFSTAADWIPRIPRVFCGRWSPSFGHARQM